MVQVKSGSDASPVSSPTLLQGFWTYSATADLHVEKEPSSSCWKSGFQPSYYRTSYLTTDRSLWLPLLCDSNFLTSGDPVKILLISSLPSLSLPSLFTFSCSSKGAIHFLNQRTPPVGMGTPFHGPSLKGRYQALPAAQGLGTYNLPQRLWAEVSTVAAAGAGDRAPGGAATVADAPHAAISTFPTGKLLDEPPLPTDSAWDLCAGPGSYTALPRCRLNGRSALPNREFPSLAKRLDLGMSPPPLRMPRPPSLPGCYPHYTHLVTRGQHPHGGGASPRTPLAHVGSFCPNISPAGPQPRLAVHQGHHPHHTRGQGHQHLPPLARPFLSDDRVTLVLPSQLPSTVPPSQRRAGLLHTPSAGPSPPGCGDKSLINGWFITFISPRYDFTLINETGNRKSQFCVLLCVTTMYC